MLRKRFLPLPLLSTYTSTRSLSIPAAFYRGGSSKGLFFADSDLPGDERERHHIFRSTLGSPDPYGRQLNGMGGGYNSVSKVLVVARSNRENADVEYTFVQVGPKDGYMGMAPVQGESTTIRIYNTNTDKVIHSTFPIASGKANLDGDFAIDGVSGTAAKIQLDFLEPGGSRTGKLFPTGNQTDEIRTEKRVVRATLMDCGNPCVFISALELDGFDPTILPSTLEERKEILEELEQIRRKALVMMGLARDPMSAANIRSIPKVCVVAPPSNHTLLSGNPISETQMDVIVRCISSGDPHKALPITAALCVAAAANTRGTVVREVVRKGKVGELVIGHPSGTIAVNAEVPNAERCSKAAVMRTAKKLFEGRVFI